MGFLDAVERRGAFPESSLANPSAWLMDLMGGGPTLSGVRISDKNALNIAAVYCAVRVLTDTLGATPALTYRRLARGKERARDHQVYRLLHQRPNPEMTPFTFKEVMQGHLALRGNAYAEIEIDTRGQVAALWPLPPGPRTKPFRHGGEKFYRTEISHPDEGRGGQQVVLPAYRVLHIPGFSFDGMEGYDPVTLARESLGFTKATDEFGARFFANGSRLSGILSTDKLLTDPAAKAIRDSWKVAHEGLSNSHRTAILDNGLKWQQIGISPENAQFLESRQFQLDEIARWFKVPPHKIYNLLRSTNNNIEHQGLEFVQDTAQPWFVRWEEALSWSLFTESEHDTYFVEFLMDALMRGDSTARGEFYSKVFGVGGLSPNDILEMENRNPVEGGDRRFVPMNMVPLDRVDDAIDRGGRGSETRSLDAALAAQQPVLEAAAEAVARAEVNAITKELKRPAASPARLSAWATEFAATRAEAWERALLPAVTAAAAFAGVADAEGSAAATASAVARHRAGALYVGIEAAMRSHGLEGVREMMAGWVAETTLAVTSGVGATLPLACSRRNTTPGGDEQ